MIKTVVNELQIQLRTKRGHHKNPTPKTNKKKTLIISVYEIRKQIHIFVVLVVRVSTAHRPNPNASRRRRRTENAHMPYEIATRSHAPIVLLVIWKRSHRERHANAHTATKTTSARSEPFVNHNYRACAHTHTALTQAAALFFNVSSSSSSTTK